MRILLLLTVAAAALAQPPSFRIPNGSLAGQAGGRIGFFTDGTFEAFGYLSFIEGLDVPMFSIQPSERSAYFTFRSEKTGAEVLPNDRMFHFIYRPLNGQWTRIHLYYNPTPIGDFAKATSASTMVKPRLRRAAGCAIRGVFMGRTRWRRWTWSHRRRGSRPAPGRSAR